MHPDPLKTARIELVVLNIYAASSDHLYAYLSEKASISAPDPAHKTALQLLENTRLRCAVIWINAEGITLNELARLEKKWLPQAGKAVMLMGANQASVIHRSLRGLMAARRDNPAFEAVVLTPADTIATSTCSLMATQSQGWLKHIIKDSANPLATVSEVVQQLRLGFPKPANALALNKSTASLPELTPVLKLSESALSQCMAACLQIEGATAAALVDTSSGKALAKAGSGINLDIAATGNAEVVQAKMTTISGLSLDDEIEDILITLGTQYHLIRPLPHQQSLFVYLVLDKSKGNLAMARYKLAAVEKNITG